MNKRLQNKLMEKYAAGFQAACDLVGVDANRLVKRAQEVNPASPILGGYGPYANSGWRQMPAYGYGGSLTVGARPPTYTSNRGTLPAQYGVITPAREGQFQQSRQASGRGLSGPLTRGVLGRTVAQGMRQGMQNLRSDFQQLRDPGFYGDVIRGNRAARNMSRQLNENRALAAASRINREMHEVDPTAAAGFRGDMSKLFKF